ncbi:MAG: SWIB/MDM2 domain-containing protein [Burkholderiaceae bacterium]
MVTAKKAVAKKAPAKKAAAKKAGPVKTVVSQGVAVKKAVAKKVAAKKVAPRKPNAAFMKAMTPSPALAAVIGAMAVPRTEVTSKLWAYIKKNNLQDPAAKRFINADDKLKVVFGKPRVDMFEMTRLVQGHLK